MSRTPRSAQSARRRVASPAAMAAKSSPVNSRLSMGCKKPVRSSKDQIRGCPTQLLRIVILSYPTRIVPSNRVNAEMFMRTTTVAMAILITFGTGYYVSSPVLTLGVAPERVSANDNRVSAGILRNGILTVRLEMRQGEWHPDGETETGVQVRAFAEEGKRLQIPGPLIRVAEGTEIRVSIRNTAPDVPLVVHGLHARGAPASAAAADTIHVPAGGAREIRFVAGAPGTYFYWGT